MKLKHRSFVPGSLDDILNAPDEAGLLAGVQPAKSKVATSRSDPVAMNFMEILDFVHAHHREPLVADPVERSLARKLAAYRKDPGMATAVRDLDDAGLLSTASEGPETGGEVVGDVQDDGAGAGTGAPSSMADILNGADELGLLGGVNAGIFKMEHAQSAAERKVAAAPDEIARRRPCEDFWKYKEFLDAVGAMIRARAPALQLKKPKEEHIRPGALFILRGQICWVDSVLEGRSGKQGHGGENRRLRVVFDSGTELDILTLSLAKALYADKNAKYIDTDPNLLSGGETVSVVRETDVHTGWLYILETESDAPELAQFKSSGQLVKIGSTRRKTVEERIAGAERDQTYLCAPVRKAGEIKCYNMDPLRYEKLVQSFLNSRRLNVKLVDPHTGASYRPIEWFTVSVETAATVCQLVVDGNIGGYRMDNTNGRLKKLDEEAE